MKILLATNMAFTAYIFQEDYDRLITHEVTHASQHQKGGSLFGQWTSTGNPVIHRALSFGQTQSDRDAVARNLYEGFRVCPIGEWRPVQAHTEAHNDMLAREARERLQGREAPVRFLVLDVSKASIIPFLLNRHTTQQERGKLEMLPGKNPFNKRESFDEPILRRQHDDPAVRHPLAQAGQPSYSYQAPQVAQFQVAVTTVPQWYSGDDGNSKLQKVLKDIKEVALNGYVDMTRDRRSQDISLSLVDNLYQKKWEIRFPACFPADGALLIENPGTYRSKEQKHSRCDKASQAVKNIISSIKTRNFMN